MNTLIFVSLPVVMALYLASWQALRGYDIDHAKHLENPRRQMA